MRYPLWPFGEKEKKTGRGIPVEQEFYIMCIRAGRIRQVSRSCTCREPRRLKRNYELRLRIRMNDSFADREVSSRISGTGQDGDFETSALHIFLVIPQSFWLESRI